MDTEIVTQWKDIPNTDGFYQANNFGQIRSVDRVYTLMSSHGSEMSRKMNGRILKTWTDSNGYLVVYICGNGRRDAINVHRLIAMTFIDRHAQERNDINHIDGNKKNNSVCNLEWCTKKENMEHAKRTGLMDGASLLAKKVKRTSIIDGVVTFFDSTRSAIESMGLRIGAKSSISKAAIGRTKHAYRHYWEYV